MTGFAALGLVAATVVHVLVHPTASLAQEPAARQVRPLIEARLPDLPRPLTGAIVGRSGGALIVAGGHDEASGAPVADAFALADGASEWTSLRLLQPLADAAAVTVGDEIICVGGMGGRGATAGAFKLIYAGGELLETPLPDLPQGVSLAGAAAAGSVVYLVGGLDGDGEPVRDSFLRHAGGELDTEGRASKRMVLVFVQDETLFHEVLEVFTSMEHSSAVVINSGNLQALFARIPLFQGLWTHEPGGFSRVIAAVVEKGLTNELVRRVETRTGDLDKRSGIM